MSRVYLSGPITDIPQDEVVRRFLHAQVEWERKGYTVFNPIRNGLPYETPWRRHMAVDLYWLEACDTVFMLDGWSESRGASLELMCALCRNVRIYFQTMPDKTLMVELVRSANEMRVALRLEEKMMFDAEWYAEQCIKQGYFKQNE